MLPNPNPTSGLFDPLVSLLLPYHISTLFLPLSYPPPPPPPLATLFQQCQKKHQCEPGENSIVDAFRWQYWQSRTSRCNKIHHISPPVDTSIPLLFLTPTSSLLPFSSFLGLSVRDIMKQAKSLGLDLFLIPLHSSGSSNVSYTESVVQGLQLLQQELYADMIRTKSPSNITASSNNNSSSNNNNPRLRLVFGDLHLEDIRAWRETTFSSAPYNYPCVFPLFRQPYEQLQHVLWNSQDLLQIVVTAWTGPVGGPTGGDSKGEVGVAQGQVGVEKAVGVGSVYDATFVRNLPEGVDPMGESGEFHTHCKFR